MASGGKRVLGSMGGASAQVPPPTMAVTDGGSGFAKAARAIWPDTKIQRCLVHIKRQVVRKTTMNPRLEAGKQLLALARRLPKVGNGDEAAAWLADYAEWCSRWERFLREFTLKDGRRLYTHERLRSARHSLNALVKKGTMFTFVQLQDELGGRWESTNNSIEGGVNSQIRLMLQHHRGLRAMRRVKAAFWWCYLHSDFRASEAEMLRTMKTDDEVEGMSARASGTSGQKTDGPSEFDSHLSDWGEMHMRGSRETGWF